MNFLVNHFCKMLRHSPRYKISHRAHLILISHFCKTHPRKMSVWVKAIESLISMPQPLHHTKRTPVSPWNNAVIHAIMG